MKLGNSPSLASGVHLYRHTLRRVLGTHLGVTRAQYYDVDESGEYAESAGVFAAEGPPPGGGRIRFDDFGPTSAKPTWPIGGSSSTTASPMGG